MNTGGIIEDVKSSNTKVKDNLSLVYYSRTGKTERFIEKVTEVFDIPTSSINEYKSGKYILITPTYNFGEVPVEINEFLVNHNENMVAVMSAGNKNWGQNFAKSGETLSKKYNVDLIGKIEMMGTQSDIEKLVNYIKQME